MIPWETGNQLVWDVTVVDALALSRLNQGSLCNPGTTATEAEARKIENYRELRDNGYIFQPVALEVQGPLGESSEIFITRLCKVLCRSHEDQRAGSFLKQRVAMALQIGNAACVLGTVNDRDAFEEIFFAHDEVNVHCSPAKEVFFHYRQLHNERLLEKSQNPREIRTCSLPIARHKC